MIVNFSRVCIIVSRLFVVLCLPHIADGCVFVGGIEPPCSAFWKADAVFVGTIIDITLTTRDPHDQFEKSSIRFAVEEVYRGDKLNELEVIATTGTDCSFDFKKNEKWLVYASRNPLTRRLDVTVRTAPYSSAADDLAYITSVSRGTRQTSILGRVFEYQSTPWEGVAIEIEGQGMVYRTSTDKEGWFRLVPAKAGNYLIRGFFPPTTDLTGWKTPKRLSRNAQELLVEFDDEVIAERCAYVQFLMFKPRKL